MLIRSITLNHRFDLVECIWGYFSPELFDTAIFLNVSTWIPIDILKIESIFFKIFQRPFEKMNWIDRQKIGLKIDLLSQISFENRLIEKTNLYLQENIIFISQKMKNES